MAKVVFGQDLGKMNFSWKTFKDEDVYNYCCVRNLTFVAAIVFGGGDDVPSL